MPHRISTRRSWADLHVALVIAVSLAACAWAGPLVPVAGQEGPLTLERCVSIAMEQNPLILSGREQYRASLARVRQAWALPQPSLDIDSDLQPALTDFGGGDERYVGISQTLPFPGRMYFQGKIAREESNEVLTDMELLMLSVTFQVKESFFLLLLAEEQLEYARQNLDLTEDFVQMTELRFEAGDLPQVEVIRARVEAARAASLVRGAENDVRVARARLAFHLGRPSSGGLEIQGELRQDPGAVDLDQLTTWAFEFRPELRRIAHSVERERAVKKHGIMSYFPDFDIGAAKHRQTGETDTWDVTFSVALPLFFWQPATGEVAEADANLRALREETTHLRNAVALEVEEAYVSLSAASAQIRLFEEEILVQAQEAHEMYQFAFQQGEIDAIDLIESRRTLNEARTAYADALFDYAIARAAIERSIGRSIEEQ